MPDKALTDESRYRLLKLLEQNPELTQRELARALDISLGKANYCIRALVDRGWIKAVNFGKSGNKGAYFYKLTASGVYEKARSARSFLDRKLEEHAQITAEIETLRKEVTAMREDEPANV